jgi:hypothetical protein
MMKSRKWKRSWWNEIWRIIKVGRRNRSIKFFRWAVHNRNTTRMFLNLRNNNKITIHNRIIDLTYRQPKTAN